MHDEHHSPWPLVACLLRTTVHITAIVLNDTPIRIHRVSNVVAIPIFWIRTVTAQQINAIEAASVFLYRNVHSALGHFISLQIYFLVTLTNLRKTKSDFEE